MKKQSNSKFHLNLALCLLILGTAGLAQTSTQNNDALFQKAQNIASSNPAGALAAYELVMQQSAERDSKVFAHAVGEYWNLIHKDNNYPRAYDFFAQLAAAHPSSADVLGSEGSAIGGYLGWLHTNGFAQHADQQFLASLYSKAHDAFEKALKIDPNNFAGLFGYAIYESYRPGGETHSKELFTRLDSLRASHPHYPWELVDQMKKQRLND